MLLWHRVSESIWSQYRHYFRHAMHSVFLHRLRQEHCFDNIVHKRFVRFSASGRDASLLFLSSSLTTEYWLKTGDILLAPSSVACRTTVSMRSPFDIPCTSRMWSVDSVEQSRNAPVCTSTLLCSARTISAAYSPPEPSKRVIVSPNRSLSARIR